MHVVCIISKKPNDYRFMRRISDNQSKIKNSKSFLQELYRFLKRKHDFC